MADNSPQSGQPETRKPAKRTLWDRGKDLLTRINQQFAFIVGLPVVGVLGKAHSHQAIERGRNGALGLVHPGRFGGENPCDGAGRIARLERRPPREQQHYSISWAELIGLQKEKSLLPGRT